ncbi:HIT family protein [Nocardia salmonicida]|uniref:HIT family protein n=1 Tax=Nocardia salmonicida TaxID=53431 RepID=UPI00362ACB40
MTNPCVYCVAASDDAAEPSGGWIYRDEHWLVAPGPAETTMPGALRVTSRRHYVDFADMTAAESAGFGQLLSALDRALRASTDAERVHVVSTRDRIAHFHAWLYPRPVDHPLRGTEFLNAPQRGNPGHMAEIASAVRACLASGDG